MLQGRVVSAHGVDDLRLHLLRVVDGVRAIILGLASYHMLSIFLRHFALVGFESQFQHLLFVCIMLFFEHVGNLLVLVLN